MMHSTQISIITPLYNSSSFIADTILSVQAQTFTDWEMIIVDDCSSDDSVHIVQNLSQIDNRIQLIQLSQNSGPAVARNTAIEAAKGRYLAFLDSDDQWLPEKIEKQLGFMMERQIPFSFTAYEIVDVNGYSTGKIIDGFSVSYESMLRKQATMGCSTVIVDRQVVGDIRMPLLRTGQDYAFWLSLLNTGLTATCFPLPLTRYRIRPGSISRNKFKKAKRQWQIYRECEKLSLPKSVHSFLYYAFRAVFR